MHNVPLVYLMGGGIMKSIKNHIIMLLLCLCFASGAKAQQKAVDAGDGSAVEHRFVLYYSQRGTTIDPHYLGNAGKMDTISTILQTLLK